MRFIVGLMLLVTACACCVQAEPLKLGAILEHTGRAVIVRGNAFVSTLTSTGAIQVAIQETAIWHVSYEYEIAAACYTVDPCDQGQFSVDPVGLLLMTGGAYTVLTLNLEVSGLGIPAAYCNITLTGKDEYFDTASVPLIHLSPSGPPPPEVLQRERVCKQLAGV